MPPSREQQKAVDKQQILAFLSEQKRPVNIQIIAGGCGMKDHYARRLINELIDDFGVARSVGSGRGGVYEYALYNLDYIPSLFNPRAGRNVELTDLGVNAARLNRNPVVAANFVKIAANQLLLAAIDDSNPTTIRLQIANNIQVLNNLVTMLSQLLNHERIWQQKTTPYDASPSGNNYFLPEFVKLVRELTNANTLDDLRMAQTELAEQLERFDD
jgi:hypothetical protein